jgi:hypothetical protein
MRVSKPAMPLLALTSFMPVGSPMTTMRGGGRFALTSAISPPTPRQPTSSS